MAGHKEQEKTGERQHDLSCPYCPLWLNLRIDGRPQRTGEDRRTSTLPLLPLLPFVAKQDRSLSLVAGFVVAPVGALNTTKRATVSRSPLRQAVAKGQAARRVSCKSPSRIASRISRSMNRSASSLQLDKKLVYTLYGNLWKWYR